FRPRRTRRRRARAPAQPEEAPELSQASGRLFPRSVKARTRPRRRGQNESNREVARAIGPPGRDRKPGPGGLALEPLASELRADLDPQRLSLPKRQLEPEPPDRDRMRLPRAEAD